MTVRRAYLALNGLFFISTASVYAIFSVYLLRFLSPFGTSMIVMLNLSSSVVLNIPTGIWTDKKGARWAVVLGFFCGAASLILYGLITHIIGFIVAALLMGMYLSLIPPALDSWIMGIMGEDGLKTLQQEKMVTMLLAIPATGLAALAGPFGFAFCFWLGAAICLVSGLFAWKVIQAEPPKIQQTSSKLLLGQAWQSCLRPELVWLIAAGFLGKIGFQFFELYWSPIFTAEFGLVANGLIGATLVAATAAGTAWAAFSGKLKPEHSTIALLVMSQLVLFGLLSNLTSILLVFFLLQAVGRGWVSNNFKPLVNRTLVGPSHTAYATTVRSIIGSTGDAGEIIGFLLAGGIAEFASFQTTWYVALVPLLLAAAAYWKASQH